MSPPNLHEQALNLAQRELSAIAQGHAHPVDVARNALVRIQTILSGPLVMASEPTTAPVGKGKRFLVYSDGGCRNNPGPAAWGAVIVDAETDAVIQECSGFIGIATNQVAEIMGAIEGLSRVPEGAEVILVSDSQYTLRGLSEWRANWIRRGWLNSKNEPVANQAYWQKLYAVADLRKVTTRWVKGHSGDKHNERCDALAANSIASEVDI